MSTRHKTGGPQRRQPLKEGSPSCGSGETYEGTFSGKLVPGVGVTTALLEHNDIRVFSGQQTTEAAEYLRYLERH